jgi:3,4-dihydroxy 2-butanone 4-phosphate synthase / GTP cyclohydrolase II
MLNNTDKIALSFFNDFSKKKIGIITDDISGDDRSVFVAPAQNITSTVVNKILLLSGGIIFVALSSNRAKEFNLNPMGNLDRNGNRRFLVSVEARNKVSTGISASDRATTLKVLGSRNPRSKDLVKPGHVFPIEAVDGGVLVRTSLVEAALDVVKATSFTEVATFCDIHGKDGEFLSFSSVSEIANNELIPLLKISELIEYRLSQEKLIKKVAEAIIPTKYGSQFRAILFNSLIDQGEHLALINGEITENSTVLTRVQSEFTLQDLFSVDSRGGRLQLDKALSLISLSSNPGVMLYLRRSAPGIIRRSVQRIINNEKNVHLNMSDMLRQYGIGAQILRELGVRKMDLLTDNPKRLQGLASFGIEIVKYTPLLS